jgi:hypothetical protein
MFVVAGTMAVIGLTTASPAGAVVSDPAPSTSGYQPWPVAKPGGDQEAVEQQNFDTYYSDPIYTATDPSADQRNTDVDDYFLYIFGDLQNIAPELSAAARAPYAADLINLADQMPFVLQASGPNITPVPAVEAQALSQANRWLQSIDLTPAGIANPDPATQQAIRQLEDTVIPTCLENLYYQRYLERGYSAADSAAAAKQRYKDVTVGRQWSGVLTAAQVAQLRDWYYNGVAFERAGQQVNTLRDFTHLADYARQHLEGPTTKKLSRSTIQRAVGGVGAYAAGKIDKAGDPYPTTTTTPIPNQCPADYVCPPLADPPP